MKPILFSSDMVRAILDGRKTVTRRVVKSKHWPKPLSDGFEWVFHETKDGMLEVGAVNRGTGEGAFHSYIKPPYQPGDILYVRETWAKISDWTIVDPDVGLPDGSIYKADWGNSEQPRWRPSIHMPREAARLFLRVTGVRVERIQEITEADAIAEGFRGIGEFREYWDVLAMKQRDANWYTNEWVWVIEFEVTQP